MMTESQALNALAREDPEAADEAKAALSWLTSGEGLETVSQLKLQEFVWYALPVKWPMTTGELIAVTRALGRLFSMVGMERYADVCISSSTENILAAYGQGHEAGIAAYAEAVENSPAAPPDTGLLAWGSVMGPDERAAYDACAAAVELAIAAGELPYGNRGWKAKRAALVDRWITTPPGHGQLGRHRAGAHNMPGASATWLARIHTERMDAWAHSRPGERSRLAAAVLPRLLEELSPPEDALPTVRWLLGHADDGLRLTARHYIPPALVTEAVDTFGWRDQLAGALRQELDVFPLHTLRSLAQGEMGAIRRSGTSLVLTRTGKLMAEDETTRWQIATAALVGADNGQRPDFAVAVREASLLFLLVSGPAGYDELTRHLTRIHAEEGWAPRGGTDLSDAVRREIYGLRHRLWALQLLYTERASREPLTLTETGVCAALAAIRTRARGPRHHIGLG
ncbi:MAG TPA: hypothetical protein VE733_02805 [Streptosporangiaceae bacterium]|jgi:hypothetical protein|nr:hypothetical protein [Streptosporangiaceae bacterium]